MSYIRSSTEFALAPIIPMLGSGQITDIERIQKQATKIILNTPWYKINDNYIDYKQRLSILELETIEQDHQTLGF